MTRAKVGNRKKGRRSSHKKGYYSNFAVRLTGKKLRKKHDRSKRLAAAVRHPEIGSPSQIRTRPIHLRRRARKEAQGKSINPVPPTSTEHNNNQH